MEAGLNMVDYLVLGVIALSTLFAFIRGFIGSFLSLVGWIASIYLTYTTFPMLKPYMEAKIKNPIILLVAGHTALLIGYLILFGIVNLLASMAVKGLTSGMIDRSLGAGFGVIRGILIVSFSFLLVSTSFAIFTGTNEKTNDREDETLPKWLTESKSYYFMKDGRDFISGFIPDSFYDRFKTMYDEISSKSMDERFLDTAISRLKKNLTADQLKAINEKNDEAMLSLSKEEAKYKQLNDLLEAYKKSSSKTTGAQHSLKKEELDRINKMINQHKPMIQLEPKTNAVDLIDDTSADAFQ